jgi:hypothetical protein
MPRKHNTTHPGRSRSRYPFRLSRRGLSKAPALEPVETLRKRQERRETETGVPWWSGREESATVDLAEKLLHDIFTGA